MVRSLSAVWMLIVAVGCGGGPAMGTVRGKVLCKSMPVAKASVFFSSGAGKEGEGTTDDNGEFVLGTFSASDGATVGQHKVRVSFENIYKVSCAAIANHPVEVKAGSNEYVFELDKIAAPKK